VTRRRLRISLRDALARYEERTGIKLTYAELATKTGLSEATVKSLASRPSYNATLRTIERLCVALRVDPAELLRWS
jgi:DNA-binding Xre family transcriptional regulator